MSEEDPYTVNGETFIEIKGRVFGPFESKEDATFFGNDIRPRLSYVSDMTAGTLFLDTHRQLWMLVRRDGALNGVYHCENQGTGKTDTFAGCAALEVYSEPQVFDIPLSR